VTGAHHGDAGGHGSSLGREPADDPDRVPFQGLRRNARALALGSLLLAGLFLLTGRHLPIVGDGRARWRAPGWD
jgi:hypothetical protein